MSFLRKIKFIGVTLVTKVRCVFEHTHTHTHTNRLFRKLISSHQEPLREAGQMLKGQLRVASQRKQKVSAGGVGAAW